MEPKQIFNLDQAIKEWQAPFRASGVFTRDNLRELANHATDAFLEQPSYGLSAHERFAVVVQQLGEPQDLIAAYAGCNRDKMIKSYMLYFLMGIGGIVLMVVLLPFHAFRGYTFMTSMMGLSHDWLPYTYWSYWALFILLISIGYIHFIRRAHMRRIPHSSRAPVFLKLLFLVVFILIVTGYQLVMSRDLTPDYTFAQRQLFFVRQHLLLVPGLLWILVTTFYATWMHFQRSSLKANLAIHANQQLCFLAGGLFFMAVMKIPTYGTHLQLGIAPHISILVPYLLIGAAPLLLYLFNTHLLKPGIKRPYVILGRLGIFTLVVFLLPNQITSWSVEELSKEEITALSEASRSTLTITVQIFTIFTLLTPYLLYYRNWRKGELFVTSG